MAVMQGQVRSSFFEIVDGATINFALSPNLAQTQIMSKDPKSFNPNFVVTPMVIKPILTVSGGGGVNQVNKACKWWINDTLITGTNATWGATVGVTAPFALTINKNLDSATNVLIRCDYDYVDALTGAGITATTTLALTRVDNAGTTILATIDPIDGDAFSTVGGAVENVRLKARMVRGGDDDVTDVSYRWAVMGVNGAYFDIIAATAPVGSGLPEGNLFTNFTSQTLTFTSDAVVNVGTFRVTITDTDTASTTYGKTAVAYKTVMDYTDPYKIVIDYPQGQAMSKNNTVGLKQIIKVVQDGVEWTTDMYNGKMIKFFRCTATDEKDATFVPAAGDFSGWTIGTGATANEVYRTYASNNGTDANRTITVQYKHFVNGGLNLKNQLLW